MKKKTKDALKAWFFGLCLAVTMTYVVSAGLKQAEVIDRDAVDFIVDVVDAIDGDDTPAESTPAE